MKATILGFLCLMITLSSCNHYYYLPNTQNVPLFKEKNEYRLAVSTGGAAEITLKEVQTAYSISPRFAIMANYLNAQGGNPNTHNWGKGNYLEGAFGYYKPLDKETIFEVYSGIGASNQQHHYLNGITTFTSTSNGSVNMSFAKLFIQPSLGITFNGVDFAFSSRLSYLSFYKIKNNILDSARDFQFVDTISKNRNSLLLEPAITIRGGWKYTKLQLQFVFQKNLNNPNLRFITGNLSLGLYISLAKRFRRNETSTN